MIIILLVLFLSITSILNIFNQNKKIPFFEVINPFYFFDRLKNREIISLTRYEEALNEFYQKGYINRKRFTSWKNKYEYLIPNMYELLSIKLKRIFQKNYQDKIIQFLSLSHLSEHEVGNYNTDYIQQEKQKYKSFFENIEKFPLDDNQIEAILYDEDYNLVVAGAGTGKTSTIMGKILHLIENKKISPKKILSISFTNKAVNEMKSRIQNKGIQFNNVTTFHKLGNQIIGKSFGSKKDIISAEEKNNYIISIINELKSNPKYKNILFNYFNYYLTHYQEDEIFSANHFTTEQEYYEYMNNHNTFISLGGVTVKSPDELQIANYLYLHNIKFKYEDPYKYSTKSADYSQYKPDFYLVDYDTYLEHFSVFKSGKSYFGKEYIKSMERKKQLHRKQGTKLITTYSREFKEYDIPTLLEQKLEQFNINIKKNIEKPITFERYQKEENALADLIQKTIGLYKGNLLHRDDIKKKKLTIRETKYMELFEEVYRQYENYLRKKNQIDYEDMLRESTSYIRSGKFKNKYEYILVDEFQDITLGTYSLLRSLLDNNPECKLFGVGDDRQSIYRFTGSNLKLFTHFGTYFGFYHETKINNCYRLPKNILRISSNFIMKNREQIRKNLISKNQFEGKKIEINFLNDLYDSKGVATINKIIDTTCSNNPESSVFVLCRYGKELESLKLQKIKNLTPMTMHKSKGLEGDIIYLCINNRGKYCFPSTIENDPILELFLGEKEALEFSEERRLFYVALTRAKKELHIFTTKKPKSPFIKELLNNRNDIITHTFK